MNRLACILLLTFYCGCVLAQPSAISINIYIEKGANAGMSYFDSDSGYALSFIRTPILTKDSLIKKVVYTNNPLLFIDGFKRQTQYPLFPGDDITIRCSAQKRDAKNNHAKASSNALLFFTALNQVDLDLDMLHNSIEKQSFATITSYTDEMDSLIQLAYQKQLLFLDNYLQKNPMGPDQQQYIRNVIRYNMLINRLMPWYNNRFKNKPLSTRYLQSIAVLKNDFTNPSLMYIRDYQFALSGFNRFLCKNVANPPSGDAMKDAFYASALQNFSPANADFLLYDLMRISAMTSKQWFLNNAERFNKDCHNPVFKALINDIGQDVALAVKTGSNSMDLQNTAGKVINLKDILEQTKDSVVYVDFWAGWCAPCIAEMPHSIKLQQQYKNRKIAFIYFSLDNTRSEWLKSMKSQPQMHASNSYFVVNGDNSALSKWVNLNSIPRYIVFDKNKKLVKNDAPRPSDKEVQPMLNLLLEN